MTVWIWQCTPASAPPEIFARYWHCGHSKMYVLPTPLKYLQAPANSSCHCMPRDEAGCPRGLKIETTRDAIHIQQLTREKKSLANFAFHRLEIYLVELYAAAGHELVLVQALAGDRNFRAGELLRQRQRLRPRERRPARVPC